jgi:hypothetical protein
MHASAQPCEQKWLTGHICFDQQIVRSSLIVRLISMRCLDTAGASMNVCIMASRISRCSVRSKLVSYSSLSSSYMVHAKLLYKKLIVRSHPEIAGLYSSDVNLNPSGVRILSWTILFATSPPFSRATAPTMAYSEVMRTDSMPEPLRSSACTLSVQRVSPYQDFVRTLFGVHRVTLSSPYRSASCDSRALLKTSLAASSDKPWSPSNAGCKKGVRPYVSGTGLSCLSFGQWFS